jgi:transposase InsO family protein
MMRIQEIGNHPFKEEIERRLKAIWLLERGRLEELKVVLNVSRSTVFLWKKRLQDNGGNVIALAPQSRAPQGRRKRQTDPQLVEFIRKYRVRKPGMGKGIIKAELDRYCQGRDLETISESSVGRVIVDLKAAGRLPGSGLRFKVIDGSGHLICKKNKPKRKKTRRNGYQPKDPGDLVQMDSITIFQDGIKRYTLSAIDLAGRFGFAYTYTSLNSQNATDFLKKLIQVAPFKINHIQTDNGSEFEKDFAIAIRDSPIKHFHNYPRHPQSNAYVERFNRTIRSQFLKYYEGDIQNIQSFNRDLIEYLLWYNIQKPHRGIGNRSPMEYYMKLTRPHRLQSNMLWTPTQAC